MPASGKRKKNIPINRSRYHPPNDVLEFSLEDVEILYYGNESLEESASHRLVPERKASNLSASMKFPTRSFSCQVFAKVRQ